MTNNLAAPPAQTRSPQALSKKSKKRSKRAAEYFRNQIKIQEDTVSGFIFKIAETRAELEQAYRLVHDVYMKEGYIEPHPAGLYLTLNSALPTATTFVGKVGDRVVTTMSLFPDSPLGMPLDSIYQVEADQIRQQESLLAEVGALASAPDFREHEPLTMLYLNKALYHYAWKHLQIKHLLIAIHPKYQSFFESLLLFKQIGKVKPYKAVNESEIVLLCLNVKTAKQTYKKIYQGKPPERSLHDFFFIRKTPCIHLPLASLPVNVWTDSLLDYFFRQQTNLFERASCGQLDSIKSYHASYHMAVLNRFFGETNDSISRLCAYFE